MADQKVPGQARGPGTVQLQVIVAMREYELLLDLAMFFNRSQHFGNLM